MTEINRLNRSASLEGGDLIPIWDSSDGATRSVSANVAGEFFTSAAAQIIQPLVDEATQAAESAAESAESAAGSVFGVREVQRRSYAEAGYTLVTGSFEAGGTVTTSSQVLLYEADGKGYSWGGTLPKTVTAGSSPSSSGGIASNAWISRSNSLLKSELSLKTLHSFGGAPSPADSTAAFNASNGTPIQIPDGVYIGSPMAFTKMGMAGRANSTVKQVAASGNFLSFSAPTGGGLSNLKIESNKGGSTTAPGHQIAAVDGGSYTLENLDFDTEGTGFAALLYPNLQTSIKRILVRGVRGRHLTSTLNGQNGCVLLVKSECSIVDGVTARDYGQFGAVELKDISTHNTISNVISENCDSTVYLGTETTLSGERNIISNIIAKANRKIAVELGIGNYNILQGVIADYTGAEVTQPVGVSMDGEGNAVSNFMMLGATGLTPGGSAQVAYPLNFKAAAKNNYANIFAHHTAGQVVVFTPGSQRNFVEISHPGARSDLFASSSTIIQDDTITGDSTSNVVHAPALGQYFGTMSGKFEWRLKDMAVPGSTLFTGDRFRFIADGSSGMAVGGGTTAQFKLFLSDGTFRTLSLQSSQSLRIDTGSGNYLQFGSTSLTPSDTNAYALGSASNAWSGGFTQTAFTVTSDERAKTEPLVITDAILDAAAEVDWVQYQYLDRVETKGSDGARWHFGAVAQRFVEAFERHGLDAHRFAFICYDEWEDQFEPVMALRTNAETGEQEEYATGESKLTQPAGNRYGIRYEEALALEAALQRRNYQRLLARVESLEVKNAT